MDVKTNIQNLIDKNDICLFMKGTPESPQCGFSMTVSNVLKHFENHAKNMKISKICPKFRKSRKS